MCARQKKNGEWQILETVQNARKDHTQGDAGADTDKIQDIVDMLNKSGKMKEVPENI